jgi:hypothetical protein
MEHTAAKWIAAALPIPAEAPVLKINEIIISNA